MDLPVNQAADLIKAANFPWITDDHIFTTSIPDEFVNDTSQTVMRIDEYQNQPSGYANRRFNTMDIGVEVQIYYAADTDFDIQSAEIALQRWFKSHRWEVAISREHSFDPDTDQLTKTIYFVKTEFLKAID